MSATCDVIRPAPLSLNKQLPLRYQVAQHLLSTIRDHPRRGDQPLRLPIETDLAQHYGVGLVTIREALGSLEEEGLISRHRRRGTFVNPEALAGPRLEVTGLLETHFKLQHAEEVEILEHDEVDVPAHLEAEFPGARRVSLFRRLRRQGGQPVSLAVNYLPVEIGRRVPLDLLHKWPMTRVLRDSLSLPIGRLETTVQARFSGPEVVRLLDVPLLSPILFFTGVTYDTARRVIDVAEIEYRGDRFRFAISFDVAASPGRDQSS